MDFLTGVCTKEVISLSDFIKSDEGAQVTMEGAVHSIRNMGEIAFIILRSREGLCQTVWEANKTNLEISELKEASCIRVSGIVKNEERAPHGKELRLSEIVILSNPEAPLPLAVDKWKLNTSLEAKLNMRSISLRNVRERARLKYRKVLSEASEIICIHRVLRKFIHRKSAQRVLRAVQICLNSVTSINRQCWRRARSFISR